MLRRGHPLRASLFALSLAAAATATTMSPCVARADDDVISLEGLPPEVIQALTAGSAMSPDVLAALLAASGGSHAAVGAAGGAAAASGGAATSASDANGAGVLSALFDGMSGDNPVGSDATHADATGAAATGRGRGVVDIRHPGDPPVATSAGHGPERIPSGRTGGLVELRPAIDAAPEGTSVVGSATTATAAPTTLAPVRIVRPRSRRVRPSARRPH